MLYIKSSISYRYLFFKFISIELKYVDLLFKGCCYLLNSAINPFLYSIFSKRFRRGFADLLRSMKWKCCDRVDTESNVITTPENNNHRPARVVNQNVIRRHLGIISSSQPEEISSNKRFLSWIHKSKQTPSKRAHVSLHEEFRHKSHLSMNHKLHSEPIRNPAFVFPSSIKTEERYPTPTYNPDRACTISILSGHANKKTVDYVLKRLTGSEGEEHYRYRVIFRGDGNDKIEYI